MRARRGSKNYAKKRRKVDTIQTCGSTTWRSSSLRRSARNRAVREQHLQILPGLQDGDRAPSKKRRDQEEEWSAEAVSISPSLRAGTLTRRCLATANGSGAV